MSNAPPADAPERGDVVVVVRRIAAPPDIVFSYLIDPARFTLWMGVAAELDARPGGAVQITVGPDAVARGQYELVEPPNRLVFTWGWQGDSEVPPGSTTVDVTLTADADGTLLELRHHGLPAENSRNRHRQGWNLYLSQLVDVAKR